MSTVGGNKSQVTRTANKLKQLCVQFDRRILDPIRSSGVSDRAEHVNLLRRAALEEAHTHLTRTLEILLHSWQNCEQHAQDIEAGEDEADLLTQYHTHWETSGAGQVRSEAEALIADIEAAIRHLSASVENSNSSSGTPAVDSIPRTPRSSVTETRLSRNVALSSLLASNGQHAKRPDTPLANVRPRVAESNTSNELHMHSSTTSAAPTSVHQHVRLAKLELPQFDGDI